MILLDDIIKKIWLSNYKLLLFMSMHCTNKLNIVEFNKMVKFWALAEATIKDFRAKLSKNWIVKKLKRNEEWHWYLNPAISELWTPNNDWLFDKFREDIETIYNLKAE